MEPLYSLPENLRVYAIGDIHGHLDALDAMHEEISMDLIRNEYYGQVHIVYLGDYVDRGPNSKGVVDRLIERRDRGDGIEKTFLKGNHEDGLLEYLRNPLSEFGSTWPDWGGADTLASYGVTFDNNILLPAEKERASVQLKEAMSSSHVSFLHNLSLYIEIGNYIFTHAGIHPQKSLEKHKPADFHFIREPFLSWHENPDYTPLEKKVVHGHTVSAEPENLPHRVSVDTGCYQGGPLSAAVLEGSDVRFLQVSI